MNLTLVTKSGDPSCKIREREREKSRINKQRTTPNAPAPSTLERYLWPSKPQEPTSQILYITESLTNHLSTTNNLRTPHPGPSKPQTPEHEHTPSQRRALCLLPDIHGPVLLFVLDLVLRGG